MNEVEAVEIAEIVVEADGGCNVCAGSLTESLMNSFPEHAEVFRGVFLDAFDWVDKNWPNGD
jgi:hypothetical protein